MRSTPPRTLGAYKPDPRNFAYLLEHLKDDLGLEKKDVLHTAQSLFHDHAPAGRAGLARAWIDRRQGQSAAGATNALGRASHRRFLFPSMAAFVEAHKFIDLRRKLCWNGRPCRGIWLML